MANASKKSMGVGGHGKGAGVGAMTDVPKDLVEENMVLSNRDKKSHGPERGLDGKGTQIEQLQDTATNREDDGKL
ncbi:hypothetical protein [uncultured Alsobacter sp.]|uniref:hypothetical protein n=1 Tax=uncultured Alsobacter sp. TaxID=1748258 RepID=UPI0025D356A5|nr:hypothetical protein [uncultured Alsobacter sp.]